MPNQTNTSNRSLSGLVRDCLEVLLALLGIGNHRLGAGFPAGGANLAVLLVVLEGLDNAQDLVHGAAHRQVVDLDGADIALGVDDVRCAQSDAAVAVGVVLDEAAKRLGHGLRHVRDQRNCHCAKAARAALGLRPGQMRELGVNAYGCHLRAELGELSDAVGKGDDLRRADKSEVQRVKEEHTVEKKGEEYW